MSFLKLQKKILPPEEKIFYTLFEESADVCLETAKLFLEVMNDTVKPEYLQTAKKYKHKSSDITRENLRALSKTFITPIDREDIQALANLLNKITKKIVKAMFNLRTYRLDKYSPDMKKQAETLLVAVQEVKNIVALLKNKEDSDAIFASHQKASEIESSGDEILYTLMDDLFSGNHDALTVIKLRDIYKNIENAMDTCFSVSDQIVNIVVKHT